MKNNFKIIVIIVSAVLLTVACSAHKAGDRGKALLKTHRTIAVLPFQYMIFNSEYPFEFTKQKSCPLQLATYNSLKKRYANTHIKILDLKTTNNILKAFDIQHPNKDFNSLNRLSDLCDTFQVDGIVTGEFWSNSKIRSETIKSNSAPPYNHSYVSTYLDLNVSYTLSIYDKSTLLLWQKSKSISSKTRTKMSKRDIIYWNKPERFLDQIINRFPY